MLLCRPPVVVAKRRAAPKESEKRGPGRYKKPELLGSGPVAKGATPPARR
jgi:hypothetical protein